tara:strand:- start:1280 stop:3160 length:1881 start_codon:yes stop_codon:yes gene_type:complete
MFAQESLVVSVARSGLSWPTRPLPRFLSTPREAVLSEEEDAVWREELQTLLAVRAVEQVPPLTLPSLPPSSAGIVYSTILVVPKADGGKRPCINLAPANKFFPNVKFKMEGVPAAKALIKPGGWMIRIDFKSAYFQVPVAPSHQDLLRFVHNDTHYRFCCLPFGLNSAPRFFTRVMKSVLKPLREKGIEIASFLDDLLFFLGPDLPHALSLRDLILNHFMKLGWLLSIKKSELCPTKCIDFLGLRWDSSKMQVSLPPIRIARLMSSLSRITKGRRVSKRTLSSVLGAIQASSEAIFHQRLFSQNLLRVLRRAKGSWDSSVFITEKALEEVSFWSSHLHHWNGRSLLPSPPSVRIFTDACNFGWGVSQVSEGVEIWHSFGSFSEEQLSLHINLKELLTVSLAVKSDPERFKGQTIEALLDNTVAISYINGKGGRIPALSVIAEDLWNLILSLGSNISARHISGVRNVRADALSRMVDRYDHRIQQCFFDEAIFSRWPLTVDAFASSSSKKLPRFWSRRPDPAAEKVDALHICWKGELLFLFPPEKLVPLCLNKLILEEAEAVLVAPSNTFFWTPLLLRCNSWGGGESIPIPASMFLPGPSSPHNPYGTKGWDIRAWRLSGRPRPTLL